MNTPRFAMPKLIATSVRRGWKVGDTESQGGIFTADFAQREVRQLVDWSSPEVDFRGHGMAFHGDEIYLAASEELFVYGRDFRIRRSYKSSYLGGCRGVFRLQDHLYLLSGMNDCVLAFDLVKQTFVWALHLASGRGGDRRSIEIRRFDALGISGPGGASGPPAENRLQLNSIWADRRGLFLSGASTGGMLYVRSGDEVQMAVEMPNGIHDARPYRDGVVFNDIAAGAVRFVRREGEEKAFAVPRNDAGQTKEIGKEDPSGKALAHASGLCLIDEFRFAAGSSPSTISLYDLEFGGRIASVNLTDDERYAIHALEIWPFDPPPAGDS